MKKQFAKLVLAKTTLRILSNAALVAAAGGVNPTEGQGQSCVASCTNNDTVSRTGSM